MFRLPFGPRRTARPETRVEAELTVPLDVPAIAVIGVEPRTGRARSFRIARPAGR